MMKIFLAILFFTSSAVAGDFLSDVKSVTQKVKKVNNTASDVTRERRRTKRNVEDYTPDESKRSTSSKKESELDQRERKLREREKQIRLREREQKLEERERKLREKEGNQ